MLTIRRQIPNLPTNQPTPFTNEVFYNVEAYCVLFVILLNNCAY